jgi:hypothetical protein
MSGDQDPKDDPPVFPITDPDAPYGRTGRRKQPAKKRPTWKRADGVIVQTRDPGPGEVIVNGEPRKIRDPDSGDPLAMKRRPAVSFTAMLKEVFITAYAQCGQIQRSCDAVGITWKSYMRERQRDPEFAERCDEAERRYADALIVELRRRAVDGWEEPVVGGRNRDEIVAYVKKYDSNLLLAELRKRVPEYKENARWSSAP